jgi:hypothetical protein
VPHAVSRVQTSFAGMRGQAASTCFPSPPISNICLVSPSVCTLPYADGLFCPSYHCSIALLSIVSVEHERKGLEAQRK